MNKKCKILISVLFSAIFLLAFTSPLSPPPSGWYQQFVTNLNGRQINDITFTDSLNGYIITNRLADDSSLVLKTTNGGDNWFIIHTDSGSGYSRIRFINQTTGFIGGFISMNFNYYILKTTNAGTNWFYINAPFQHVANDMFVLSEDTIWIADQTGSFGGVFRTTNGGSNWQVQYQGNNPNKIYMYDHNLGFISPPSTGTLYRTTNSGENWIQVPGAEGFNDIKFIDNLTGWKTRGQVKKTTNGGLNWVQQTLPSGGSLLSATINKLSVLNEDTLWGIGGQIIIGSQTRGIIYRTTNGGINWSFQVPDTLINIIVPYSFIQFINSRQGWAYTLGFYGGIHTTTGGDPIWYTDVNQVNTKIPDVFKLHQNYPNPFNPITKIKYQISKSSNVKLVVFDIGGKRAATLVNENQNAGIYEVEFSGEKYSSGIYFYRIEVKIENNIYSETKRMILLK